VEELLEKGSKMHVFNEETKSLLENASSKAEWLAVANAAVKGEALPPSKEPELQGKHIDTLICLVENGPLWCGDVPSKTARDDLIEWGYAINTYVKCEGGYHAITEKGVDVYCKLFGGNTPLEAMTKRKANRA
jgi:hypothetical protein